MTLAKLWQKIWLTIANEPLVVVGVVIAAVNASQDQTVKGYVVAGVVALLRFLVAGPLTQVSNAPAGSTAPSPTPIASQQPPA